MLSDIIRPDGQSCSNIDGLTNSIYLDAPVNTAAVLTTLESKTLPANVFGADGDFMEFEYFGTFAGGNATELSLYFGSDVIFYSGVVDPGNEEWTLRGKMVRTGPATQYTLSTLITSSIQVVKLNSTAIAFGPAVALAVKGIGNDDGDVSLRAGFRQFYFQNR